MRISFFVLSVLGCVAVVRPGDIIPLKGTLVSGVAYYDPGPDKAAPLIPASRVQMYCAWGQYDGEIYDCQDIWGEDCTSAGDLHRESNGREWREVKGLFHFYHPDIFENRPVSLMHRLDDSNPCSQPGTAQGRYFSRFYSLTSKDKGKQLKAEFILHPTFKPPSSIVAAEKQIAVAEEQIGEVVAVRYFYFRRLRGRGVREESEESVRQAIKKEVAIILDSLRDRNPREVMAEVRGSLKNRQLRDRDKVVSVLDWLPKEDDFWLRRDESWDKERKYWEEIRPLLESRRLR